MAFADVPFANAEYVALPVTHALPLPDDISFETAASVLLQGLTAHYLATDSHQIKAGEQVLIHAVAGGVGQLLTQITRIFGAKVIGLTSSEEKAAIARQNGADESICIVTTGKDRFCARLLVELMSFMIVLAVPCQIVSM